MTYQFNLAFSWGLPTVAAVTMSHAGKRNC